MATAGQAGGCMGRQEDAALIARLTLHDEGALRTLIETSGKYVYGKALQILREPRLAEEVAQDTLLTLWWRPSQFDISKGSIRSFLMGVARHKAIDLVRREETFRSKESALMGANTLFEHPPVDDEVENAIVLRAAILSLPIAKREVIFLAFYRGLTYKEVSQVLGLPEGTVKTRIRDSLVRLKFALGQAETA